MRTIWTIFIAGLLSSLTFAQERTIHVFVALCDNENQGIIAVQPKLGNGKDPRNNLYCGAAYGVKSYFKYLTNDWRLVESIRTENPSILERLLFKHATEDVYLLADAYDGAKIKTCVEDFLKASNGQAPIQVKSNSLNLNFGGGAGLIAFIGHDWLMDFSIDIKYNDSVDKVKDVIILACFSKQYFSPEIKKSSCKSNFVDNSSNGSRSLYFKNLPLTVGYWVKLELKLMKERPRPTINTRNAELTGREIYLLLGFE